MNSLLLYDGKIIQTLHTATVSKILENNTGSTTWQGAGRDTYYRILGVLVRCGLRQHKQVTGLLFLLLVIIITLQLVLRHIAVIK
jgi:hypothetical protein